jgi:hypothetical protein
MKRTLHIGNEIRKELRRQERTVASHYERNMSGFLLEKLQNHGFMINIPRIEPLFYLDPIEILNV